MFKDKFVVGYFGRFSEEKCPGLFVDIADLLQSDPKLFFIMTGDGPEYKSVMEKIAVLGLTNRVYAPGIVSDIKPFLNRADVVLIPSRIEGIPIILFESMSMGKPVIASSVGGIPDIIEDGHNGFLCEPGDTKGFAAKIRMLHSSPGLRETIGANARAYAEKYLDVAQMKEKYLHAFMTNMKKSGGADR
jgi:glycosyltransferase involved in cell wall biosynthesis